MLTDKPRDSFVNILNTLVDGWIHQRDQLHMSHQLEKFALQALIDKTQKFLEDEFGQ